MSFKQSLERFFEFYVDNQLDAIKAFHRKGQIQDVVNKSSIPGLEALYTNPGIKILLERFISESMNVKSTEQLLSTKEKAQQQIIKFIQAKQVKQYDISQFRINVEYDQNRIDIDLFYQNRKIQTFELKKYLLDYVIQRRLLRETFVIESESRDFQVQVADRQWGDQYTDHYTFNPFFNSIKFKIQHKTKLIPICSLKITNALRRKPETKFKNIQSSQHWVHTNSFSLHSNAYDLVKYHCQKLKIQIARQDNILLCLKNNRIKKVSDLLQCGNKDFIFQILCKDCHKLGHNILNALKRVQANQEDTLNEKRNCVDKDEKNCYKRGTSFKILRFLVFQILGEHKLKTSLPKVHPDNVDPAFQIIQKRIKNNKLFNDIRDRSLPFFQMLPEQKLIRNRQTPPGILFYGPPGTGKTQIINKLWDLIGFHLITPGLSSAEFFKELVGQQKGVIESYLMRSALSPHLMCSIAIDEFQPIVKDRNQKDSKSGQGIACLLSKLGGIQNIENLVVLATTNIISIIDPAILRRFTPYYFVGIPSKQQRKQILQFYLPLLEQPQFVYLSDFIVSITPNFSGPALKNICRDVYSLYEKLNRPRQLPQKQIIKLCDSAAKQFKLKFGQQTYPSLYGMVSIKLNRSFFKKVHKNVILCQQNIKQKKLIFHYCTYQNTLKNNNLQPLPVYNKSQIRFKYERLLSQTLLQNYLRETFQKSQFKEQKITVNKIGSQNELKLNLNANYNSQGVILLVSKDVGVDKCLNLLLRHNYKNCYIFLDSDYSQEQNLQIMKDQIKNIMFPLFEYRQTGRILIDITNCRNSILSCQLNSNIGNPIVTYDSPFITQRINTIVDILPQMVDRLMLRGIDFLQYISKQTLNQNNSYTQESIKEFIKNKFQEMQNYKKCAVIIDLDSIIHVTRRRQKGTDNNMQQKQQISNWPLYYQIIQYIKKFKSSQQDQKICIFVTAEQEIKKQLKHDIRWPQLPQDSYKKIKDQQRQHNQKKKKQKRKCFYCPKVYTQEQNQKSKSCQCHFGQLVDNMNFKPLAFQEENRTQYIRKAITLENMYQKAPILKYEQFKNFRLKFIWSCCLRNLDSQPCGQYYHWGGNHNEQQDETAQEMNKKNIVNSQNNIKQMKNLFRGDLQQKNIRIPEAFLKWQDRYVVKTEKTELKQRVQTLSSTLNGGNNPTNTEIKKRTQFEKPPITRNASNYKKQKYIKNQYQHQVQSRINIKLSENNFYVDPKQYEDQEIILRQIQTENIKKQKQRSMLQEDWGCRSVGSGGISQMNIISNNGQVRYKKEEEKNTKQKNNAIVERKGGSNNNRPENSGNTFSRNLPYGSSGGVGLNYKYGPSRFT